MDYKKIYDELILYRQVTVPSGYTEKHHIQMRSLGGTDDESNLIKLTAREHYIAHLLLAKFNRCSQTAMALWMMQMKPCEESNRNFVKNSRMYEWARKEFILHITKVNKLNCVGNKNSQFGTRWQWVCNPEIQSTIKIRLNDPIPSGYTKGYNSWIPKKKRPKKPYTHQLNAKTKTLSLVAKLKTRYNQLDGESKRSMFTRIVQNEKISIGSLYSYW